MSGVKEPSPKKPRLSTPNGTLNTRRKHCGDASKVSLTSFALLSIPLLLRRRISQSPFEPVCVLSIVLI